METLERIKAYLENQLSLDEKKRFEGELATNAELRSEVEEMKAVILGIQTAAAFDFADKVRSWEQQLQNEAKIAPMYPGDLEKPQVGFAKIQQLTSHKQFRWMAIAASVLIIAGIFFFMQGPASSSEGLYASHFVEPENPFLVMGENEGLEIAAFKAYENGDFQKAIQLYQEVLNEKPEDAEIQLLMGIAYLKADQPATAISTFDKIIQEDIFFDDKASWYKVLALLKTDDKSAATNLLKEISSDQNHDYYQSALDLLKELE